MSNREGHPESLSRGNKALNTPEAKHAFDRQFTSVIGGPASDLAETVRRDRVLGVQLANKIGLKPE